MTCWLVKSISVWMPRLPTIRVIGSHDISLTITRCCSGVSVAICVSPQGRVMCWLPARLIAGGQAPAAFAPLRFLVVFGLDVAVAHELHDRPVAVLDDPLRGRAP